MILFVIATILSIASPFVSALFAMVAVMKYYTAEKHPSTEPIVRAVIVVLALALPGWIMVAFGYLWFSTSCAFLLIGLVFLAIAMWTHTAAEAFFITAVILVCNIHFGLEVHRAKESRERKMLNEERSSAAQHRMECDQYFATKSTCASN